MGHNPATTLIIHSIILRAINHESLPNKKDKIWNCIFEFALFVRYSVICFSKINVFSILYNYPDFKLIIWITWQCIIAQLIDKLFHLHVEHENCLRPIPSVLTRHRMVIWKISKLSCLKGVRSLLYNWKSNYQ